MTSELIATGVRRLDTLLEGGLPTKAAALLYGPAFLGKELLLRKIALANMKAGRPVVFVTTNATTSDVRRELRELDTCFGQYESAGLARFVDTYSIAIGAEDSLPHANYLDSALDLNGLSVAVNRIQRDIVSAHDHHLIVIDSLSTLIAHSNAQTVFRFMQIFVGRTRLVGAVVLALMDEGMHSEAELQMFKHVMNGMLSFRDNGGKPQLLVQGLGAPSSQPWIEYAFGDGAFELTGSFAAGRIR